MIRQNFRGFIRVTSKIINYTLPVVVAVFGVAVGLDKKIDDISKLESWQYTTIDFVLNYLWLSVILWAILNPLLKWVDKNMCSSFQEKLIRTILEEIYKKTRPDKAHDGNYRVTLFKYRTFSWAMLFSFKNPVGGWLSPYERSGHQRRSTKQRWKVNLEKPSSNQGVAGKCYAESDSIHLTDLITCSNFQSTGARKAKKRYAKLTHVSEDFITIKNSKDPDYEWPKSFWGIKILANGKPWGVLLIDSTLPNIGDDVDLIETTSDHLDFLNTILTT